MTDLIGPTRIGNWYQSMDWPMNVLHFSPNDVFLNLIQEPTKALAKLTNRGAFPNNMLSKYKRNNA